MHLLPVLRGEHNVMLNRYHVFLLPLYLLTVSALSAATDNEAQAEELLRYRVTYQGVFTLMKPIEIADVALISSAHQLSPHKKVKETQLVASSENYGFVESLYPFRYRARAISLDHTEAVLAFDRYKKTRKEKLRSYWLGDGDAPASDVYHWLGEPLRLNPATVIPDTSQPHLDQLTLLQHVRAMPFDRQKQFEIPVTTGKKAVSYRVVAEKNENLMLDGRPWPTWKLRFDGIELKDGKERPIHRPVYVWLTRDKDRIPVRFESRQSIGRFTIDLVDKNQQIAAISMDQE